MHVYWLSNRDDPSPAVSECESDGESSTPEPGASFNALFSEWVELQEQLRYATDDGNATGDDDANAISDDSEEDDDSDATDDDAGVATDGLDAADSVAFDDVHDDAYHPDDDRLVN